MGQFKDLSIKDVIEEINQSYFVEKSCGENRWVAAATAIWIPTNNSRLCLIQQRSVGPTPVVSYF